MDDLLREFLTETSESLDTVDNQLVRFEQDPNNAKILDNIFRLVHTIKGTCGFLGLAAAGSAGACRRDPDGQIPRRHAGDGGSRDADPVLDRPHQGDPGRLEATEAEPEGTDRDLIDEAGSDGRARHGRQWRRRRARRCRSRSQPPAPALPPKPAVAQGTLVDQTLERPLRPGEVSLDELERAFRETAIEAAAPPHRARAAAAPSAAPAAASRQRRRQSRRKAKARAKQVGADDDAARRPTRSPTSRSASTSTRSNI